MGKYVTIANKLRELNKEIGKKSIAKKIMDLANQIEGKKAAEGEEEESAEIKDYRRLLNKLKGKDSIKKLKIFFDKPRLRKPIRWWLNAVDKGEGAGAMDVNEMVKQMKILFKRDLPSARFLKMLLDYGLSESPIALDRILSKGRAKVTLMKSEG